LLWHRVTGKACSSYASWITFKVVVRGHMPKVWLADSAGHTFPIAHAQHFLLAALTRARTCRRLRQARQLYPQSFVVRQGSQMEMHVLPFFVEDRGPQADGYIDYMLRMHKAVLSGK